jgi:hypothetical protein
MSDVVIKSGQLIQLVADDIDKYIRVIDPEHVLIRVLEFNPPIGSEIHIEHVCMKTVVFDICIGATIRLLDRFYPEIMGMYGVVTLKCVGTNEWVLFGALTPKPQWQTTVDKGLGLTYDLHPVVDVDWAVELAILEASIGSLETPTSATVVCTVSEIV